MKRFTPVRNARRLAAHWGSYLYDATSLRDVLMLTGLGLLSAGSYLIYEPSALVVSGGLLFYLGVWHR